MTLVYSFLAFADGIRRASFIPNTLFGFDEYTH